MSYIGQPVTRLPNDLGRKVDPRPAIEHIEKLQELGMTYLMIERAAGVSNKSVSRLLDGTSRTVREAVLHAILSVDGKPHPQQALVLNAGTRRRLEGLAVLGWTTSAIASEIGCSPQCVQYFRKSPRVTYETHVAVAASFDRLGHDGGSERTKMWAAAHGFVHPLLWDDIDDPFAEPLKLGRDTGPQPVDDVVVQRLVSGRVTEATVAERRAAFARLDAQGLSCQQIASILRTTVRTIDRYRAQTRAA